MKWNAFKESTWFAPDWSFVLDLSFLTSGKPQISDKVFAKAIQEMKALEQGELVNIDEKRMVGHYWLRAPHLAPRPDMQDVIRREIQNVKEFARKVHSGEYLTSSGCRFRSLLVIGIGGSALGPQLLAEVFRSPGQTLQFFSLDNTDPDGIALTLSLIPRLEETLVLTISKSGGTKETRNGMLLVEQAFRSKGLVFADHAVAVTGEGSALHNYATSEGWRGTFPMWDWVGGRTSLWSPVGLLPAALLGADIDELLAGAAEMDGFTRRERFSENPAALLSAAWLQLAPSKDMVVLPYKDRLLLLSRYLQQLIMESLGKRLDRDGKVVEEGLAVYGNKGSTDQHAYIQQLRDGRNNFFALFIEVLVDQSECTGHVKDPLLEYRVEQHFTSGDFLHGFFLGTRTALAENQRESISLTVKQLSARSFGGLIALFERAVSFYASYTNINAYHQPGVEAGKKAAEKVLVLQSKVLQVLQEADRSLSAVEVAERISEGDALTVFKILQRQAALAICTYEIAETPVESRFHLVTTPR